MARPSDNEQISVSLDEGQYQNLQAELSGVRDGVRRAIAPAINKTLAKGRTIYVDGLFEVLNTTRGVLRERVRVQDKANPQKLSGTIRVAKSRIGLGSFSGARDTTNRRTQTGEGVFVKVLRGGSEEQFPHAFIDIYRGHAAVLERKLLGTLVRTSGARETVRVGRTPLIPRIGPSAAGVLNRNPDVERGALELVRTDLNTQLLSQIDRLLGRRKIDRPTRAAA